MIRRLTNALDIVIGDALDALYRLATYPVTRLADPERNP
jgi:hypothetical protein